MIAFRLEAIGRLVQSSNARSSVKNDNDENS